MGKKIILCFDGTCNDPEDAVQEGQFFGIGGVKDNSITNVLKLHLLLGGNLKQPVAVSNQMSFYYPGVGTYGNFLQRLRNKTVSPEDEDVGSIIKAGIKDLYKHYQNGDDLFIFGFSRGAAIARRFASVLEDTFDALDPDRIIKVRFLGVFDTVAAINTPNLVNASKKPASDVLFENHTIASCIKKAVHLVALDERRIAFQPTLMNKDDNKITEVWFPGAHADVGGGYHYDGLSDIALKYMLDTLSTNEYGLTFIAPEDIAYKTISDDPDIEIDLEDMIIQPNPFGKDHVQEAITPIKENFLGHRTLRVNVKDRYSAKDTPIVHSSVIERIQAERDYKPTSLRQNNRLHPYTGEVVKHQVLGIDNKTFASLSDHRQATRPKLKKLAVDDKAIFTVYANQQYNSAGIVVSQGEQYIFEAIKNQRWYDGDVECGPEGWERNDEGFRKLRNWIIGRFEEKRRCPDAKWYELCAVINKNDDRAFRVLQFEQAPYTSQISGELFAFANDLENMYGNNRGCLEVVVRRLR